MAEEHKAEIIVKRRPSSYSLTQQQLLIKEAHDRCGIRKGMPRRELVEAMTKCLPEFFSEHKKEVAMADKKEAVKVYHSPHCEPCKEAVDLIQKGRFECDVAEDTPVDLVDVTSEEGFSHIEKEGVEKVPSATYKGKACKLSIDKEYGIVVITCQEEQGETEDKH